MTPKGANGRRSFDHLSKETYTLMFSFRLDSSDQKKKITLRNAMVSSGLASNILIISQWKFSYYNIPLSKIGGVKDTYFCMPPFYQRNQKKRSY